MTRNKSEIYIPLVRVFNYVRVFNGNKFTPDSCNEYCAVFNHHHKTDIH